MTALADATDPRFTGAQLDHLARFEAAEEAEEALRERLIDAIDVELDSLGLSQGMSSRAAGYLADVALDIVTTPAVAAYRAQDGGAEEAVRRVLALAEELDERGDIEHAEWRQRGQAQSLGRRDAYETSAELIRAALCPQAGGDR